MQILQKTKEIKHKSKYTRKKAATLGGLEELGLSIGAGGAADEEAAVDGSESKRAKPE